MRLVLELICKTNNGVVMNMKKIVTSLLAGMCGWNIHTIAAIQDSIVPAMEWYESVKHLCPIKYSRSQYIELVEALSHKKQRLRVVSYNLLLTDCDAVHDEKYHWPQRLPRIVSLIKRMDPDILGTQELDHHQITELVPQLEKTWAFYGEPSPWGEYHGIFYKKERFQVIEQKVLCGEIQALPAKKLTMLWLKDLKTEQEIVVFNTHLNFPDVEQRAQEAQFIADYIDPIAEHTPVIMMGDLNTFPHRLDLQRLPFYDGDYIHRILTSKSLREAKDISLLGHLGPISTFTNQGEDPTPFMGTGLPGVFLDHVYVSKQVTVLLHAVESGRVDELYPSDHMPVIMDCIIEPARSQ